VAEEGAGLDRYLIYLYTFPYLYIHREVEQWQATKQQWFIAWHEQEIFLFSKTYEMAKGPNQPPDERLPKLSLGEG
jgi:hypothetical protein